VNHAVLQVLHPEHVEVEICRSEELDYRRGLTSELDEMWSYVRSKANPRWLCLSLRSRGTHWRAQDGKTKENQGALLLFCHKT